MVARLINFISNQPYGSTVTPIYMRNDINSYINSIFNDNKRYIAESGCSSVAEYIINDAEATGLWHEFFDRDNELEGGDPTCEQINEFKDYLREYWNDPIACECYYTYDGKEVFLADPSEMPEDIKPVFHEGGVNCQAYELKYWFDYLENNGLSAQEANEHPNLTYLESYCGTYADDGAEIIVARLLCAESKEHYLYDWTLVADLEDVNETLSAHGFDENDIPNEFLSPEDAQVLQNIKNYELAMSNTDVDYQFSRRIAIDDDATLYLFQFGDIKSSAISYADGTTFVLDDWQGSRPESEEEIADYNWVSAADGRKAIVMDGLPRLF